MGSKSELQSNTHLPKNKTEHRALFGNDSESNSISNEIVAQKRDQKQLLRYRQAEREIIKICKFYLQRSTQLFPTVGYSVSSMVIVWR